MFSHFHVISARGDTIINREFRNDVVKGRADLFFRHIKTLPSDSHPIFNQDGITFIYLYRYELYFVLITQQNINVSYCLELLQQMIKVFKDFCGIVNEESIRRNFVLIYELIDEMIDSGYPQTTSTQALKQFIHNEAFYMEAPSIPEFSNDSQQRTISSKASSRPIASTVVSLDPSQSARKIAKVLALTAATFKSQLSPQAEKREELFVDLSERISVTMNSYNTVLNSYIDGSVQIKSYLSGNPRLKFGFNEGLVFKAMKNKPLYKAKKDAYVLSVDDCNFSEKVDSSEFYTNKILYVTASEGEFNLMNYRITDEFPLPVKIHPELEQIAPDRINLLIELYANIPHQHHIANMTLLCPLPKLTSSVTYDSALNVFAQNTEYDAKQKRLIWTIHKLQGKSRVMLKSKITFCHPVTLSHSLKREIGPIQVSFCIPMFYISKVQVDYLRVISSGHEGHHPIPIQNPLRWVRYATHSRSYVCRL